MNKFGESVEYAFIVDGALEMKEIAWRLIVFFAYNGVNLEQQHLKKNASDS